jgi:hypothetical protein
VIVIYPWGAVPRHRPPYNPSDSAVYHPSERAPYRLSNSTDSTDFSRLRLPLNPNVAVYTCSASLVSRRLAEKNARLLELGLLLSQLYLGCGAPDHLRLSFRTESPASPRIVSADPSVSTARRIPPLTPFHPQSMHGARDSPPRSDGTNVKYFT